MRRLPLILACALPAGGCAYAPLAPVLVDAVNSSRSDGIVGENFEAAAAEACSARAARYGRLTLGPVQRVSDTMVRVAGTVQDATRERVGGRVQDGIRERTFTCDFRSNGRIARFRI